jgi:outer membrane lipoprotein SlyB
MKARSLIVGSMLVGLAMSASAQQTPADDNAAWQQHWQQMQEYRQAWQSAKTPEERQKLRDEHLQSMQSSMGAMGGCPMGGPGAGMGKQGGNAMPGAMGRGGMMGAPSKEMLDMRIQNMEQMLEQMRSHRQMLDKQ